MNKTFGCGFLEPVYHEALSIEFQKQNIPFEKEKILSIIYKDIELEKKYVADFICFEKIIVEVKALSQLVSDHEAQVLNYLKATQFKLGILINFGETYMNKKKF